mmetsp:Transcript_22401/g.31158  ORF Transcript_22401/g.31158 Transcript_22401/m.31158 type:complete len:103 (+) Transcript_22401:110-418(+)
MMLKVLVGSLELLSQAAFANAEVCAAKVVLVFVVRVVAAVSFSVHLSVVFDANVVVSLVQFAEFVVGVVSVAHRVVAFVDAAASAAKSQVGVLEISTVGRGI